MRSDFVRFECDRCPNLADVRVSRNEQTETPPPATWAHVKITIPTNAISDPRVIERHLCSGCAAYVTKILNERTTSPSQT